MGTSHLAASLGTRVEGTYIHEEGVDFTILTSASWRGLQMFLASTAQFLGLTEEELEIY